VYVSVSTAAHAQGDFETTALDPKKRLAKVEQLLQRAVSGLLKNANVRAALPKLLRCVLVRTKEAKFLALVLPKLLR
jgi:hypothetical protein